MRRSREKGAARRMQRAREKGNRNNRGNYLRAPRRRNRRKRDRRKRVGGGGREREGEEVGRRGDQALSSRLFNYLSRSRISLLCRARIRQRCDFANYSG